MSRSRSMRHAAAVRVRLLGWLLAVPLVWGVLLAGTPTPALAASPTVTVTISSMTPASATTAPASNQRLQISGTLANTSSSTLTFVQVYLWRDTEPITSASALNSYLDSDPADPVGRRAVNAEKGVYAAITTPEQPSFEPGRSASFTVSAQLNLLGFSSPGVYPVGVQVRAVRPDGTTLTVGRARTMMAVQASAKTALTYSPVVVLSSRPSLLAEATFADQHLVSDLNGRLGRLLQRARQPNTTVLVDPALIDEVTALKAEHTVVGTTLTAAQLAASQKVATTWLSTFSTVLAAQTVYRLPYANADLSIPLAAGSNSARDRVVAATTSQNVVAALPLALLPTPGTASGSWLQFVAPLKPALVLADGTGSGVHAASGLRVQGLATGISDGGPAPDPSGTPVQQRSLLLAESLIARMTRGSAPVVAVSTDADLGILSAVGSSATATQITQPTTGSPTPPDPAPPPDTTSWSSTVRAGEEALAAWGEVTTEKRVATVLANQTLARSLSPLWPGLDEGTAFVNQVVAQVGDVLNGKRVYARMSSEFVLSSDTNVLPATVTNTLSNGVRVKMTFSSENPQRIQIPDTDVLTVPAGETATLHFSPHPSTNGVVTVQAQLRTPEGRPLGTPIRIVVRATSFGRVGWIIVVASGMVFMGLTTLRIRQVQRERALTRSPHGAAAASEVLEPGSSRRAPRFPVGGANGQTGEDTEPGPGEAGPHDG